MRLPAATFLLPVTVAVGACSRPLRTGAGGPTSDGIGAEIVAHNAAMAVTWPLAIAGAAALVGAVACLVLKRRIVAATLLVTGLILTVAPGWIVEVFERITWPVVASAAAVILAGAAVVVVRLVRIIKTRREVSRW